MKTSEAAKESVRLPIEGAVSGCEAYVNQHAVLRQRSEPVERLYWSKPHRDVIGSEG